MDSFFVGGHMKKEMENFVTPCELCKNDIVKKNFKDSQFVWVLNGMPSEKLVREATLYPRCSAPPNDAYDVEGISPAPLAEEILADGVKRIRDAEKELPDCFESYLEKTMREMTETYGSYYNLTKDCPSELAMKQYMIVIKKINSLKEAQR